jgi:hypothetical protein
MNSASCHRYTTIIINFYIFLSCNRDCKTLFLQSLFLFKSNFMILQRLFLVSSLMILSWNIQAQDIRMFRDTVLVDDTPYAVFQSMGSVTKQMYSIKNLDGEVLMLIDQSQLRDAEGNALMRFMFTGYPDKKAFMPVSLQFRRRMMRSLVAYNLIEKKQLNEKGLDLFCRNYPGYFETNRIQGVKEKENVVANSTFAEREKTVGSDVSSMVVTNNKIAVSDTIVITASPVAELKAEPVNELKAEQVAELKAEPVAIATNPTEPQIANNNEPIAEEPKINYSIVNRDIDQPIYLDGNVIRQDFEEVGLYTVERIKPEAGDAYAVISIYDIRHDFVAEAIVIDNNNIYEFKTYKDGRLRRANVAEGDVYETVKSLAAVLSQLLYL